MKTYSLTGDRTYLTNDQVEHVLYAGATSYHVNRFTFTDNTDVVGNRSYHLEAAYTLDHAWTPWEERLHVSFEFTPTEKGFTGMMTVEREPRDGERKVYRVFVDGWVAIAVLKGIADPSTCSHMWHCGEGEARFKHVRIAEEWRKAMDAVLTLAREAHKAEIAAGDYHLVDAWQYMTPCDTGFCDTFGGI